LKPELNKRVLFLTTSAHANPEDTLVIFGRNAGAGIGDCDADFAAG
jgi:hypothetical protein